MTHTKHQGKPHGKHQAPPEAGVPAWMDEPDIGSGEKTPGERETEAIVRAVAPTGPAQQRPGADGGGTGSDAPP
jgi:hypothetical protein